MNTNTNTIKKEWLGYYQALEDLRKTGAVNMFGAAPVLAEVFEIDIKLAREILTSWMNNYDELSKQLDWR